MTIYHVETQEDYNALMVELEEKGRKWLGGAKPTQFNKFKNYGKDTYIFDESGVLSFSSGYYFKVHRSNETLIEYKAKGENMTQEEMKQKLHENALDVFVKVQPFYKSTSESESDLQEAKSSAKKLIEKIDEYLESQKPKFKVGDYVTDTSDDNHFICKIEKLEGNDISGIWYCVSKKLFFDKLVRFPISNSRLSTQEEIAEYESALIFHKHGRKPFEVRQGDIISYNEFDKFIVDYEDIEPEFETFDKEKFIRGDLTFLKTAEEVNEWLENK